MKDTILTVSCAKNLEAQWSVIFSECWPRDHHHLGWNIAIFSTKCYQVPLLSKQPLLSSGCPTKQALHSVFSELSFALLSVPYWFSRCCYSLMVSVFTRYIEASKARLYHSGGNSAAPLAQAVLLYVFENVLKLLHPFMPFVTEELWQVIVSYYFHIANQIDCGVKGSI